MCIFFLSIGSLEHVSLRTLSEWKPASYIQRHTGNVASEFANFRRKKNGASNAMGKRLKLVRVQRSDVSPVSSAVALHPFDDFIGIEDLFLGAAGAILVQNSRQHRLQALAVGVAASLHADAFHVFVDEFLVAKDAVDVDAFEGQSQQRPLSLHHGHQHHQQR